MNFTKRAKILIGVTVIVTIVAIGTPLALIALNSSAAQNSLTFTLLDNAGIMIEYQGLRIYVDPINLPASYGDLPADAVLVTHPHGDHYQSYSINLIQKPETINVFPENMTDAVALHNGISVNPGDQVTIGFIEITAFYMYTFSIAGYPATHPREANWTSYIIDINGFTFFHAGDSKNIPEYYQLTGSIDVALLPLGPGCQTMAGMEVVEALDVIQPTYFIPIHYGTGVNDDWVATYGSMLTDCQIVNLSYFSSHMFTLA
jgi:L-ascorbate metabolism protein UlaG (beta-lactamase superfamily)